MEVSDGGRRDLPGGLQGRVSELVAEAWEVVTELGLSPAEAEERVAELTRKVGCEILSSGYSERHGRQTGPRRSCECGGEQELEGYRGRWIVTLLGEVRYRRAYYRCPECRRRHYAGDAALGVLETSYTLPAQEAVSLVCSGVPFQEGREVLSRLTGLLVSVSHLERLSEGHGGGIEGWLSEERRALFGGELTYLPEARGGRLYVGLDGTKTRFRDDWHETRLGAVYSVEADEEGRDQAVRTTYVTEVQEGVVAFGERLYQEAERRGVGHAEEVIVIGDGAPWIWNLAAEHFPSRVEILDYYHASERLHTVGKAVYGEASASAGRWAKANEGRLLEGRVEDVLRSLKSLRPATETGREAVRLAVGYFSQNRQRMRYDQFRAQGYHIGSGVVEAGCKYVVGTRCKRSGMRWTTQGARNILALRCLLLNQRWDEYWQPLKRAA